MCTIIVVVVIVRMNGLNVGGKYIPSTTIRTEPLTSKYTIQGDIGRYVTFKRCFALKHFAMIIFVRNALNT